MSNKTDNLKVKLRFIPKDQAAKTEVTDAGHKHVLDVTLKIKKTWESVLEHVFGKWEKVNGVRERLDVTLAKDGGAATDIMWGANLNASSLFSNTVEDILMRESAYRLMLFEIAKKPPGAADSVPLVVLVYSFVSPSRSQPPPSEASFSLPPGFNAMGDSWLQAFSLMSGGQRAGEDGGVVLIPATHSLIQVPQQHSMDWISALGSQLSYPVAASHSMQRQPDVLPSPTKSTHTSASATLLSPQKSQSVTTEREPAEHHQQQTTPNQSPTKTASTTTPRKPSAVSTPQSTRSEEQRSSRKHVRFAPDDEISQILLSPSKKPRVEEIAVAKAVFHGHVYNNQPVSAKKAGSSPWASFDRKGRSRPELKRIRPTFIQHLDPVQQS